MKLVAVKCISDQLPEGAHFELPDLDARVLIEMGLAKEDLPEPPRGRYRRLDLKADPF